MRSRLTVPEPWADTVAGPILDVGSGTGRWSGHLAARARRGTRTGKRFVTIAHRAWMMRAYAIGLGAGTQVFTEGFAEVIFGRSVLVGDLVRHPDGTTTLTGSVIDQAQLDGLLNGLRDVGAVLLEVSGCPRAVHCGAEPGC